MSIHIKRTLFAFSLLAAALSAVVPNTLAQGLPAARTEAELPKRPASRLDGHPDLSGYWQPDRKDKPGGNIGKDYPACKLPVRRTQA